MPAYGFTKKNVVTRTLLAGWTIGTVSQYSSGTLLAAPASNNGIGTYLPGKFLAPVPRSRPGAVPQEHQLRLLRPDQGDGAQSGGLEGSGAGRIRQRNGLLFGFPRPAPAGGIDQSREEIPGPRTDGVQHPRRSSSIRSTGWKCSRIRQRAVPATAPTRSPAGLLTVGSATSTTPRSRRIRRQETSHRREPHKS